jgi:hypothetical protein
MTFRWFLAGVAAAIAFGWGAAQCHLHGWAPVGLLPLGVGVGLGSAISRFATRYEVAATRRLVAGAVCFALVSILTEHAWLYHDFRGQWRSERQREPHVALFRPEQPWSPLEYFGREATAGRIVFWTFDAALLTAGTVGMVALNRGKSAATDDANNSPTPDP